MNCRLCGCSDFDACVYDDGQGVITCVWVEVDLCSFCDMSSLRPIETITTGGLL